LRIKKKLIKNQYSKLNKRCFTEKSRLILWLESIRFIRSYLLIWTIFQKSICVYIFIHLFFYNNSILLKCYLSDLVAYFENTYDLYETLFTSLVDDSVYYLCPDRLRLPLIFYYGHTAAVFINKLVLANKIKVVFVSFYSKWIKFLFK
jgi:hypothetical protein